jgi:hypothetical protein
MNTLGDVKKSVRSILGDDTAEWSNDGYLVPKIQMAYRTQTLYIKQASGSNLEKCVLIPDDAGKSVGRASYAEFQQPGKLLDGLYEVLYVWWKPAGAPDTWFGPRCMLEMQQPPFSSISSPQLGGRAWWNWRGNQLSCVPFTFPIDVLVDGRFNPNALTKDDDVLSVHPDMETTVWGKTLAIVGTEAGNPGWQQAGVAQAEEAADNIVAEIIRSKQGRNARAGTNGQRWTRRGFFWA